MYFFQLWLINSWLSIYFTLEKLYVVEGATRRRFDDYCSFFPKAFFFNFTFFVVLFTIVRGDLAKANINKCQKNIICEQKTGSNLNNGQTMKSNFTFIQ